MKKVAASFLIKLEQFTCDLIEHVGRDLDHFMRWFIAGIPLV